MENRDKVVVLLAGGRLVQREGGALSEEELSGFLPEDLRGAAVFQKWSLQPASNYTLRMCGEVLDLAASLVRDGARGVVVTCSMQGLAELAYFADLVWNLNPPLLFTSSIFYADSPSSETSARLEQAVRAAISPFCAGKGALICARDAVYSPADVMQISNFRGSGVLAFPDAPLAVFAQPGGELLTLRSPRRRQVQSLAAPLARNILILTASLGDGDLALKALLDKRAEELDGLVIAGLGDGDVPSPWVPLLRKLHRSELPIVLTAPLGSRVQPEEDFEGSAAQLLGMGLLNAGALSPHQARIRLAVGLSAGLRDDELRQYLEGGL